MVLRRIKDRVSNKFNCAIAEVGDQDDWQSVELGFSVVSNEYGFTQSMVQKILTFIEDLAVAKVIDDEQDYITYGDEVGGEPSHWEPEECVKERAERFARMIHEELIGILPDSAGSARRRRRHHGDAGARLGRSRQRACPHRCRHQRREQAQEAAQGARQGGAVPAAAAGGGARRQEDADGALHHRRHRFARRIAWSSCSKRSRRSGRQRTNDGPRRRRAIGAGRAALSRHRAREPRRRRARLDAGDAARAARARQGGRGLRPRSGAAALRVSARRRRARDRSGGAAGAVRCHLRARLRRRAPARRQLSVARRDRAAHRRSIITPAGATSAIWRCATSTRPPWASSWRASSRARRADSTRPSPSACGARWRPTPAGSATRRPTRRPCGWRRRASRRARCRGTSRARSEESAPPARLKLMSRVLRHARARRRRRAAHARARDAEQRRGRPPPRPRGSSATRARSTASRSASCSTSSEGGVRVSLRSKGAVDVGAVAARLGGGGHRAAAGCFVRRLARRGARARARSARGAGAR